MKNFLILFFLYLSFQSLFAANNFLPNVVLIVSDDHGTNDLGCYGNDMIKTPNLDKLSKEGIRFSRAYATSASCTASRSVILSGIYNHANGLYGHMHHFHHFRAYDHIKSLPVLLEELAGYRTARVGKYHLAPESVYCFQKTLQGDGRNSVEMAKSSKQFIIEKSDSPFFLYFCTTDPHRGGGIVQSNPLKPDRFGNRDEDYEGVTETIFDPVDVIVPPYLPDSPESRAELAQYYQSVSRMDQGIGLLFEELKKADKWENTVVVYISDNGIAFPGAKTNVYEPGIKLPCIIKYPGNPDKNSISDEMINWADLTPTILDIAGVLNRADDLLLAEYKMGKENWDNTVNNSFQGRSFKSVLEGNPKGDWNETYASHTFHEITMYYPMRVVISGHIKLIWNITYELPFPHSTDLWESSTWQQVINSKSEYYANRKVEYYIQRPEFELYDLSVDPLETDNLIENPKAIEIIMMMKDKLKDFQERTNDPWIVKWEYK